MNTSEQTKYIKVFIFLYVRSRLLGILEDSSIAVDEQTQLVVTIYPSKYVYEFILDMKNTQINPILARSSQRNAYNLR